MIFTLLSIVALTEDVKKCKNDYTCEDKKSSCEPVKAKKTRILAAPKKTACEKAQQTCEDILNADPAKCKKAGTGCTLNGGIIPPLCDFDKKVGCKTTAAQKPTTQNQTPATQTQAPATVKKSDDKDKSECEKTADKCTGTKNASEDVCKKDKTGCTFDKTSGKCTFDLAEGCYCKESSAALLSMACILFLI